MMSFPQSIQVDSNDCGPTCLHIICKYHNKKISKSLLHELCGTSKSGTNFQGLSNAAEELGFKSTGVKCDFYTFRNETPLPCIVNWHQSHFVVVYKISKNFVFVSDPAIGLMKYRLSEFLQGWASDKKAIEGYSLILEPTKDFYNLNFHTGENGPNLIRHLISFRNSFWHLVLGLLSLSIIQFIFPFLTQVIVDIGINQQNLDFIYLILAAQIFLFLGKTSIEFIRGWTLLQLSTQISVTIMSDFLAKLMKLPISFFDTRVVGDLLQRVSDHYRIERILTNSSLDLLFSIVSLLVFVVVLAWYSLAIFFIFIAGSIFYLVWLLIFLKKRRELDYKSFYQHGQEQGNIIEILTAMQDIKLHNAENIKKNEWEQVQVKQFELSKKSLILEQVQAGGSTFLNELKNISITAYSAILVVNQELTLGMMLAISYIVGQLNSPILRMINFIRDWQDAKIAFERFGEIYGIKNEDGFLKTKNQIYQLDGSIRLFNIFYKYPGNSNYTLKNISCEIPQNKVTAIVGPSGSGKSTLLKLLLKFYKANNGKITVSENDLSQISHKHWRSVCGVVMQEGYIFSGSISSNVAISQDNLDNEKIWKALKVAQIDDFVKSLSNGIHTKVGAGGVNLSTGEKQRILIARAVYKDPKFLFFDEATSSLDSRNEMEIVKNLANFYENRTCVIIAHRLSTIKKADNILVLSNGTIVEQGSHSTLMKKSGFYANLIRNQLELAND